MSLQLICNFFEGSSFLLCLSWFQLTLKLLIPVQPILQPQKLYSKAVFFTLSSHPVVILAALHCLVTLHIIPLYSSKENTINKSQESHLLRYCAVPTGIYLPTFRRRAKRLCLKIKQPMKSDSFCTLWPVDMVWDPKGLESLSTQLWHPHISQCQTFVQGIMLMLPAYHLAFKCMHF
jgi:hypothetical protein